VIVGGAEGSGRSTLLRALEAGGGGLPGFIHHWESVAELVQELRGGDWPERGLILVDAARGIEPATRRDVNLMVALGVRDLVLAINKIDSADPSEGWIAEISAACRKLAARASGGVGARVVAIPVSALTGENVSQRGDGTSGYSGPPLDALLSGEASGTGTGPADPADAYRAVIAWTGARPLLPGRAYTLELAGQAEVATVAPLRYRLDLDSGQHVAANTLGLGELGACDIELGAPIVPSVQDGLTISHFLLRDRLDGEPLGVGVIEYALRRSDNVRWQPLSIGKSERSARIGQKPTVLWLTGLSGAGKSTIANLVEAELHRRGHHTYLLDGDNVRHGLNSDLGFTDADRVENIRRVAEVARLMADAGLIVLVSFISPFRAERTMARSLLEPDEFFEVWVDTPLEVAEQRDPKGLYGKARRGELVNFTGIDSPYEPPERPEIHLDTTRTAPEEAAGQVLEALEWAGRLRTESARD
jgi:bifunctional enzyme CysN/CysC